MPEVKVGQEGGESTAHKSGLATKIHSCQDNDGGHGFECGNGSKNKPAHDGERGHYCDEYDTSYIGLTLIKTCKDEYHGTDGY